MKAIMIEFAVAAGTYDGETNWKYVNNFSDCDAALTAFKSVQDYPVVEFHLVTTWDDGTITRVPVFGGPEEKLTGEGGWVPSH